MGDRLHGNISERAREREKLGWRVNVICESGVLSSSGEQYNYYRPYIISVPNTRIRWRASLSRHCTGQRVYMVVQRSLHTHTNTHAHTGRLCVTASYIPSGSSQPPTYTTLRLQTYTLSKLYSCTTTGHGIPKSKKRENIFLSCAVFLEI